MSQKSDLCKQTGSHAGCQRYEAAVAPQQPGDVFNEIGNPARTPQQWIFSMPGS